VIRRLARTGVDELMCRGRQAASKLLERTGVVGRARLGSAHGVTLERFRACAPRHFFDGAVSDRTPSLVIDRMPAALDEIVKVAEAACRGRFDLLGYEGLAFGNPVDWSLDPVSGCRAPREHWSLLNPLDGNTVGDSKVVWELNRHQWMVQLGQAYGVTGELRYARAFTEHVGRWIDANPPGVGINWASSLEVSFRLIAWCWALMLLRGSPVLSPAAFDRIVRSIWAHAAHVERYLSYYFSPNTHLTGEALGLVYAGLIFPELPRADRWRELGTRILVEQSARHILPDGVYFELSTGYQRYTLEFYLHLLILSERNGWPLPPAVAERVGRMVDFLLAVRCPDGSMPQIGDADGGTLLPLARRAQDDFRGVLATAAVVLGRADCAWAAGGPAPEVLWLLGPAGLEAFDALRPAPPAGPPSRLFASGGYAVMRGGWAPDDHQLIFDVGPLGCPVSGGHGHADLLSVQCAVFGEPYLVDSGTYCYAGDLESRGYFRSTAAHSAVVVDGESQAAQAGPFRWTARPDARLLDWHSTSDLDFAEAHHRAYVDLPGGGAVHRRRVVFVKGRYWVIVDDLEGDGEHNVDLQFQFAPLEVQVDPTLWARARGRTGTELLVRPFASVALKASVHTGDLDPLRGWVSPIYGRREPAPLLVYSTVTTLPLRVLTLLLPSAVPHAAVPSVSSVSGADGAPVGLVLEDTGERLAFGERGLPEIHKHSMPAERGLTRPVSWSTNGDLWSG
jgi:Heparinase II/III-like protein/Heparinase II/III N-terminus